MNGINTSNNIGVSIPLATLKSERSIKEKNRNAQKIKRGIIFRLLKLLLENNITIEIIVGIHSNK